MYIKFAKYELYIETNTDKIEWVPLIETGNAGLVVVFLIFWIAANTVALSSLDSVNEENHNGKNQTQHKGNF